MSTLNILVIYDRWEEPDESNGVAGADKAPLTRTLDKKEVEDEVAEALGKLGHQATLHVLDGSLKSLHALARIDCDLVFNLAESFAGNDTADYCIAAYLELIDKRFTGSGSHGLLYAQDKGVAKKILEFHGIHTPVFARSYRGRLDFSHDLEFPVIVKPAREDGSIGIEFNAVVSSIRELMERIDWLHANFNSPVLIEEYVEGREMYVGVLGNENPVALPVVELDLSKLPEGRPKIAGAEVKWAKGTGAYRDTKSIVPDDLPDDTVSQLQTTALAAYQALELRDYARIDMRLRPDGRVAVIEANPEPVAGVESGVRHGRAQGRPHLHAAGRRDRRPGAGALRVVAGCRREVAVNGRGKSTRRRFRPMPSGFRLRPERTHGRNLPVELPQIERDLVAGRRRESIDRVGRPGRAHAERVRHDPRTRTQLLG